MVRAAYLAVVSIISLPAAAPPEEETSERRSRRLGMNDSCMASLHNGRPMIQSRAAIVLFLLAVAGCASRLMTDDEIERAFRSSSTERQTLIGLMATEPERCWRVSVGLENGVPEESLLDCPGLPVDRARTYSVLLRTMHARFVIRQDAGSFLINMDGGLYGTKGLLYSTAPLVASLTERLDDPLLYRKRGKYYKQLAPHWYIYFDSHRWRG